MEGFRPFYMSIAALVRKSTGVHRARLTTGRIQWPEKRPQPRVCSHSTLAIISQRWDMALGDVSQANGS